MNGELVDCLIQYPNKIGPISIINLILRQATDLGITNSLVVLKALKGTGVYDEIRICPDNLEFLDENYLVWYKPNKQGQFGIEVEDSYNYKLSQFRDELISGSPRAFDIVNSKGMIDELKKGLKDSIYLITIKDTSLNKSLLVDGTKRFLALHYIKSKLPG